MTVFALRMSKYCNAVSKKHGDVAKDMWKAIWPEKKVEDVPITAITNGVHLLTWMDPIWLQPVLDNICGARLDTRPGPAEDLGGGGQDSRLRVVVAAHATESSIDG